MKALRCGTRRPGSEELRSRRGSGRSAASKDPLLTGFRVDGDDEVPRMLSSDFWRVGGGRGPKSRCAS